MRIGINVLFNPVGGSLTNLLHMLEAWEKIGAFEVHQFILFTSKRSKDSILKTIPSELLRKVRIVTLFHRDHPLYRIFVEQFTFNRFLKDYEIDVLFCPANTMPLISTVPCVILFQNAAPFCKSVTIKNTGLIMWIKLFVLGCIIQAGASRARYLIFISSYFQSLLAHRFKLPFNKGVVIHRPRSASPPPPHEHTRGQPLARYGITKPYFLTISHVYPHKNILELIEGFVLTMQRLQGREFQR